jgi:hypothetical protein
VRFVRVLSSVAVGVVMASTMLPAAVVAKTSKTPRPRLVLEVAFGPRSTEQPSFDYFWFSTLLLYADGRMLVRVLTSAEVSAGITDDQEFQPGSAAGETVAAATFSRRGLRNRPGPYVERRFRSEDVVRFEEEATQAGVTFPVRRVLEPVPCNESLESIPRIRRLNPETGKFFEVATRDCVSFKPEDEADLKRIAAFVRELGAPKPFGIEPMSSGPFVPAQYVIGVEHYSDAALEPGEQSFPWPLKTKPPKPCQRISNATFDRSFATLFAKQLSGTLLFGRRGSNVLEITPVFPGSPHRNCPLPKPIGFR